jgi:hypothetical protein
MSCQEVGIYWMLLLLDWQETGFEYEVPLLARWCRVDEPAFNQAWKLVSRCFTEKKGRLYNPRLEIERQRQEEWRLKSQKGGLANAQRWLKGGSRVVEPKGSTPTPSPTPTPVTTTTTATDLSAAPTREPGKALATVPKPELTPRETAVRGKTAVRLGKQAALDLGVELVFTYWRDRMGFDPDRTILNEKRRKRILDRLLENSADVSELLYCVDGAVRDDWTMGRAPNSTKPYNGTETIFRDREKVEGLVQLVKNRLEVHPYLEDQP